MFLMGTSIVPDTKSAMELGNRMIAAGMRSPCGVRSQRAGLFAHVCNEHGLENEEFFYRFSSAVTQGGEDPVFYNAALV